MRVLGIDPSTHMGVSVVESGGKVLYTDEVVFKKLDGFERIQKLCGKVIELKEEFNPDLIVIESMFVGHVSSAITVIQIGSFIRFFLWQEGILYLDVPPTVLKKWVVGSGTAKKEQVMMAVLKRWGYESKTNNIADAVGLGMFGLCCLGDKCSKADQALPSKALRDAGGEVLEHVEKLRVQSSA